MATVLINPQTVGRNSITLLNTAGFAAVDAADGAAVPMALPYGLAAKLYFDEEDNARLNYFLQEYASRLDACDRWVVAF